MRAAIVLAAGRSRRFGRADKLFAPLDGVSLLLHAIHAARRAPAARVIVVTTRPGRVRGIVRAGRLRGVTVVPAPRDVSRLSASIAAGVRALRPVERDAFLFLGDMPLVDQRTAGRLATISGPVPGMIRPRHAGTPGHPVLVRGIRNIPVGTGEGGMAGQVPVRWIEGGRGCIADVDRRSDLARVRRARLRS